MLSSEMISIVGPAFVAGVMIALTHAPLGIEVLKRGIIFIDLALAQIAGLGLVAVSVFLPQASSWLMQTVALTFALLAGLLFQRIEKSMREQQEAIIGVSFVLAASLALLLLADHPHGGEKIQHLLSGQMLFITWKDVAYHAPIYGLILTLLLLKPSLQKGIGFYLLFALAITSSVQLVGVYVVFASLILPALAVVKTKNKYMAAWSCGIISIVVGIIIATLLDIPAGPLVVASYVLTATLFRWLIPSNEKHQTLRDKNWIQ